MVGAQGSGEEPNASAVGAQRSAGVHGASTVGADGASVHDASAVGTRSEAAARGGELSTDVRAGIRVSTETEQTDSSGRWHWSGFICRVRSHPGDLFRRLELMGTGRALGTGTSIATRLLLDFGPSGLALAYDPMLSGSIGTGPEQYHLFNAQLTYALLDSERGRLRLTGGAGALLDSVEGSWGPRGGIAATYTLAGAVLFDGQLSVTPWPFTEVDSRAAVALEMAFLRLEAGMRWTIVRAASHRSTVFGPYFGAGLAF